MKKIIKILALISISSVLLSGCTAIAIAQKYWPRKHDPVMFDRLVDLSLQVESIDCDKPDWIFVKQSAEHLSRYAQWRSDPQLENLKGLEAHTKRMEKGGSKMFCELGKKTALQRIDATKSAWEGR